jgi:hypothetical protein
VSNAESRNGKTFFASSPDAHSNLHWSKAKMILSFILGLILPAQLYLLNNPPFEGPGSIDFTQSLIIAPAYVIFFGWYGIRGPVLSVIPAPLVLPVESFGALNAIQTLLALPIAIFIWRTGTGHAEEEMIQAATLLNLMILLVMAVGLDIGFMGSPLQSWLFCIPLFPGMATVGFYYVWKVRHA